MLHRLVSARRLAVIAMVAMMPVSMIQAPAAADPIDDGVNTVGTAINARRCSVSASGTTVSNRTIRGSGSMSCNVAWFQMTLIVCLETSPTGAPGSWAEAGCAAPEVGSGVSSLGPVTHSVPCPPQAAYWRVRTTGEATNAAGEVKFLGMISGIETVHGCAV